MVTSRSAIYANSGTLTINNFGTTVGGIVLDGAKDIINNHGVLESGSQVNLGSGGVLALGAGSIIAPGGGGFVATTSLAGDMMIARFQLSSERRPHVCDGKPPRGERHGGLVRHDRSRPARERHRLRFLSEPHPSRWRRAGLDGTDARGHHAAHDRDTANALRTFESGGDAGDIELGA